MTGRWGRPCTWSKTGGETITVTTSWSSETETRNEEMVPSDGLNHVRGLKPYLFRDLRKAPLKTDKQTRYKYEKIVREKT